VAKADTSTENPQKLNLSAGVYDLQLTDDEVSPPASITLTDISAQPPATIEKTVDFSEGRLKVKVLKAGQPYLGHIHIFRAETKKMSLPAIPPWTTPRYFSFCPAATTFLSKKTRATPRRR